MEIEPEIVQEQTVDMQKEPIVNPPENPLVEPLYNADIEAPEKVPAHNADIDAPEKEPVHVESGVVNDGELRNMRYTKPPKADETAPKKRRVRNNGGRRKDCSSRVEPAAVRKVCTRSEKATGAVMPSAASQKKHDIKISGNPKVEGMTDLLKWFDQERYVLLKLLTL